MTEALLDIEKLSAEQRIELAETLWESLGDRPEALPLTAPQAEELDRRVAAYEADRDPGSPWRDVIERIEKRSR